MHQPGAHHGCRGRAEELREDERRSACGCDTRESIGEAACNGDGRVGEASGGGKSVSGGYKKAHGVRHGSGTKSRRSQYGGNEAEGCNPLGEVLGGAGSDRFGDLYQGQLEHRMGDERTGETAGDLCHYLQKCFARGNLPLHDKSKGHVRIEMSTGQRSEYDYQHHQNGTGRQGIAEQCQGDVAVTEALGHDARADYNGQQCCASQRFGGKSAGQIELLHGQEPLRRSARGVARSASAASACRYQARADLQVAVAAVLGQECQQTPHGLDIGRVYDAALGAPRMDESGAFQVAQMKRKARRGEGQARGDFSGGESVWAIAHEQTENPQTKLMGEGTERRDALGLDHSSTIVELSNSHNAASRS